VKFIEGDEDGILAVVGDFLLGQPNVVTETTPSDFFAAAIRGIWVPNPHNPCWDGFVKWSEAECRGSKSLLLAYRCWLAQQHGARRIAVAELRCVGGEARFIEITLNNPHA
jgi:hypothetical protein